MSELFKTVLSLSISGTLLFFLILALKPIYRSKLSKRWQYYIWLIVIARMLLPFAPEETLIGSVYEYLGGVNVPTIQPAPAANDNLPNIGTDDNYVMPNTKSQVFKAGTDTTPSNSTQAILSKVEENLWILWVVIAFSFLTRKITMYQSFVRFVKAGRIEVDNIETLNMLADVGEVTGIKRSVDLFINPLISSPMLIGFFRPYIIIPDMEYDRTELAYIMRHELTHYKHLDMFYKWLVQITVCVQWFNPFSYLLAKEISKCCELSCDEAIIRTLDKDEKKAYGDTLLKPPKVMGNYNEKLAAVTLTEGGKQLKERLDSIMKFKKGSKITAVIMLLLTFAFAVSATAMGAYAATSARLSGNSSDTGMPEKTPYHDTLNLSPESITSNSYALPNRTKDITISFDIDNGGIELLPAERNEIEASYDEQYYDVSITNKRGKWNVKITGMVSMMGKTGDVKIYIPDVTCAMEVNVLNGSFSYALPEKYMKTINITAQNAGINFISNNKFKNSAISLKAKDQDFIKYEPPIYPNYFTKTKTGFEYKNGTEANKITISLLGYTSVNFEEQESASAPWSAIGANGQQYTYS